MQFERGAKMLPFCRVRYTETKELARTFATREKPKYSQPKASGTRAYFAPLLDWRRLLTDVDEPLIITEGEKKALAAVVAGFPVIGLGGVFNFMASVDALLPELDAGKWRTRELYICFDSDAALNPNILAAEARLVDELQRKRGARCRLVRIPQDGDEKVGLDDFLLAHGQAGLTALLLAAPSLGALDAKIVSLNKSVAWIERENLVYDRDTKLFIPKESFVRGSRFSSLKHITVGNAQKRSVNEVSVAEKWLTHPHAQRYSEVLFRPGEGPTVQGEHGRAALNLWTGFDTAEGDVQPFLDLTEYLFSQMRPEDRELPLKLIAYKAQHPAEKIPLALVLLGPQGCGKSLWGEIIRDAFAPYSVDVTSKSFAGEFQGWLEHSLFALINEAENEDMLKGGDVLKSLISDLKRPMNEKYRPARQISTYTMYMLTSNRRAVGAFAHDDRRMIVIDCPPPLDWEFYFEYVKPWKDGNGPRALMGYLLNMDLGDWRPPASAPMSAEKYIAYTESLSSVSKLAEKMKTATDQTVCVWLDQAMAWGREMETCNNAHLASLGRATVHNVNRYQVRDWYTAEELSHMFPAIIAETQGRKFDKTTPVGMLSRELREAGVPYLQCSDDPRGFKHKGMLEQYLVVCNFADWKEPLSQNEFDRMMGQWPRYGGLGRKVD